jgi:predicted amidohydrolase YtcJ
MLIIHPNIRIDSDGAQTGALLVREGEVVATGDDARRLAGADDAVIKPDCACLMPAMSDAHAHPWGLGQRAGVIDLRGAGSPAEVMRLLGSDDAGAAPIGWVMGSGWDDNRWAGAGLKLAELDAMFPGVPVFLLRVDYHAAWVNSAALRMAGIGPGWVSPGGGRAVMDARGEPTGLLIDDAMEPVQALMPPVSLTEELRVFEERARMYRKYGVATVHNAYVSVAQQAMMRELSAAGPLPLRIYSMIDGTDAALEPLLAAGPVRDPAAMLSGAAIKFFADGAMGSRGAQVWEPYLDGSMGLEVTSAAVLAERARALMAAGWQVCVHAIGDRAASHVLDAYEGVPDAQRAAARPRLEHAQMMRHEDIARMGRLGVIASIQPVHMVSDSPWAPKLLGAERMDRVFAFARMVQAGCRLAAGSDHPIDDPSPWRGIEAAVRRVNRAGEVFYPDQALGRVEILRAYLEGAAWAARWEGRLGRLERGYVAEVIGLTGDPWTCEAAQLGELEVCWGAGAVLDQQGW